MAAQDTCSKVELSVSCAGLADLDVFSKSDPVVFLYERHGRDWIKLGRTEMIDNNLNPKVRLQAAALQRPFAPPTSANRPDMTEQRPLCVILATPT